MTTSGIGVTSSRLVTIRAGSGCLTAMSAAYGSVRFAALACLRTSEDRLDSLHRFGHGSGADSRTGGLESSESRARDSRNPNGGNHSQLRVPIRSVDPESSEEHPVRCG